jgi:hypothetical protein
LALDTGFFSFGPTPVALLVVVLVLAIVGLVVVGALSQAGGKLVDKRWPAGEPLTPSEVLWGESGSYVSKNFPGLNPTIARDLTQYMVSRKVAPGDVIIEAGDLPTRFVMLKSGAAEQLDRRGASTPVAPGATFGADDIIRRQQYSVTVRATAPCEIITLEAEDYLAGVALGMSDDDDDYVVGVLAGYMSPGAPPIASAPAPAGGFAPPPPMAPKPVGPKWPAATHSTTADTAALVLPAGDRVLFSVPAGTEVQVFESLPGWAHIRTEDGRVGWASDAGLKSWA